MIKQIAVFLENKEGKVSACCKVLKEAGVNLYALSIADTKDFGILRMITDNNAKALEALKEGGFLSSEVELVGLEVPDKAGALSDLLIVLGDNNINVEYMYSYAGVDGHAKIAFKTAVPDKAIEVLKKVGANII
ncbi:MAG: ACT domain-containing protein [Clostridiales bacterium]|nr:ACT domain-containing protein [Clostridiales bacterium]